ncbi:MAG: hypothetical protein HY558_02180 [Euryarchaeota archaeon]|nr:hypothetical protein [Euryarchaeota archaeon]
MSRLSFGWMSICREPESVDLLRSVVEAIRRGELDLDLKWVFINRRPGKSPVTDRMFAYAREQGIPTLWFPAREFQWDLFEKDRREWTLRCDREYMKILDPRPVDFALLGRMMHIFEEEMCGRYTMVNLHHAVPWGHKRSLEEVIWEHIRNRDPEAGTMLHLTTTDLDRGPPLAYFRFPIGPRAPGYAPLWREFSRHTYEELRSNHVAQPFFRQFEQDIYRREQPFVQRVLGMLATGDIRLRNHQLHFRHGAPKYGLDLTDYVESQIQPLALQ